MPRVKTQNTEVQRAVHLPATPTDVEIHQLRLPSVPMVYRVYE